MVRAAGLELNVREWGRPDAQPLLFLHALGPAASGAFLDLAAAPLVDRGLRLVAIDQPGYGRSPAAGSDRYTLSSLTELAWSAADALDLERVILGGHSWGGAIACHAVAAQPDRARALVLLDSGHLDYADVPGVDLDASVDALVAESEAARLRVADRDALEDLTEIEDPRLRARVVDVLLEAMTTGDEGLVSVTPGAVRGRVMYELARARQSETWSAIAAAGIPTLLLLATEPESARALNTPAGERFGAIVTTADVVHVDGASHSMMVDLEERLGTLIAEWLGTRGVI